MKPKVPPLTDEEEAEIQREIAEDPDNEATTRSSRSRALRRSLPRADGEHPPRPWPSAQVANPKQAVTLRLDPETVAGFKAQGPDWRARMSEALKQASKV